MSGQLMVILSAVVAPPEGTYWVSLPGYPAGYSHRVSALRLSIREPLLPGNSAQRWATFFAKSRVRRRSGWLQRGCGRSVNRFQQLVDRFGYGLIRYSGVLSTVTYKMSNLTHNLFDGLLH
ncbi:hypothetical protein [Spirosoma aerophilum]